MKQRSIHAFRTLLLGLALVLAGSVQAQQYPIKPVRIVTPYAPGGSTDILARLIAVKLTNIWRQQVFVENRPGGNTIIGSDHVAKSAPDGQTFMLQTSGHVINPSLVNAPYDAIKDFTAVATVAAGEFMLVVHPSMPAGTLQEFIALAQSRPGQINYATSGAGSSTHLASEHFNIAANVKMTHIPYKGGGPALIDLLGGQVQVSLNVPLALIQHIKAGKLRALAITGDSRISSLPQVPTFAEAGLPAYDAKNWYGIFAPAGLPRPIVDRWSTEMTRILSMPDVKENLIAQGMDPFIQTPDQFSALLKSELAKYVLIIKTANLKLD